MATLLSRPPRKVIIPWLMVIGFIALVALALWSVYMLLFRPDAASYIWGWTFFVSLLALAVLLVASTTTLDAPWWRPPLGTVIPAFAASACLIPGIAAVAAIVAYLSGSQAGSAHWSGWLSEYAVLLGLLAAIFSWPLLALLCRRFTHADSSNPRTYSEISERLEHLRSQINVLSGSPKPMPEELAYREVVAQCAAIERELGSCGMQWVSFTGYIDLWNRIHRAEEALMHIQPNEMVVSGALYDEWCIQGSTIENRDDLLSKLRFARKVLSRSKCFDEAMSSPATPNVPLGVTLTVEQQAQSLEARQQEQVLREQQRVLHDAERQEQEPELRAILRLVRRSRNEFRDGSREGLVRARNRLFKTGVVTAIAGFVLLSLAIMMDAGIPVIVATVAFYLVGAIVGLFNRLLSEADNDQAIDDYGLTTARLIHTPLFSGLAAVGGVVLIAMLPIVVDSKVVSPLAPANSAQTAAVGGGNTDDTASNSAVRLEHIFSLDRYPFGIVIAAIFGLTPGLLVTRLQSQTDKYKLDLKSTQPSERDSRITG